MEAGMLTQFAEMPQVMNNLSQSISKDVYDALQGFCDYEQNVLPLDGLEAR
jgi:hypothetical protein